MVRSPYNRNRRKKSPTGDRVRRGGGHGGDGRDIDQPMAGLSSPAMIQKAFDNLPDQPFVTFLPGTNSSYSSPRLGTQEILIGFSKMPWLHAVVSKIGQAVGMTEWKIFAVVDRSDGGPRIRHARWAKISDHDSRMNRMRVCKQKNELIEIEDHPLLEFLDMGNDALLGQNVISLTEEYLSLVGEAFWIVEKDSDGFPIAPWPVPPHWVKSLPTESNPHYVIHFQNRMAKIPVTEVIPFLRPDPHNPYGRGIGFAKALGDELESDEYSAKHVKNFFLNRARPDIIISGDSLSRADTARLEERWQQEHKGFWNAFKPHFLNRKVEVKEVGQSFESMQMVELRRFERDMVLQVFGVSPEKFGVISQSNRSTITAADLFWTKDIVKPRVQLIRNTLQKYLVPMFDSRIILDFQSPAVEDRQLELDVMRSMPGAYSIDEWRMRANLPEKEGGDRHIMRSGELVVDIATSGSNPGQPPQDPSQPDQASGDVLPDEMPEPDINTSKSSYRPELKDLLAKVVRRKIAEKIARG